MDAAPSLVIVHKGVDELSEDYNHHCLYNVFESGHRFYNNVNIPILDGHRVIGSNHGWLFLVPLEMHDQYCRLWNPKTMDEILLPPLEQHFTYFKCVLTKPPTESDCRILLNMDYGYEQAYCKIGDESFKTHTLRYHDEIGFEHLNAMSSFKGRIYGFVEGDNKNDGWYARLVSIDFDDDRLQFNLIFEFQDTLDAWSRPWSSRMSGGDYIVADGVEQLLFVRVMQPVLDLQRCSDLRVFRIDPERKECVEMESIGDRTLFLAPCGDSFCCVSSLNQTNPNSIYYKSKHGDKSRTLYVYNMDDGSTTTFLPSPSVPRYASRFSWIHQEIAKQLLMFH